jgi:hypothetical protein
MATTNSTRSTRSTRAPKGAAATSATPVNQYSLSSPSYRAEVALEMAIDIRERMEQHQTLAGVVSDSLAPTDNESDSVDWHAYRLAQLLEDLMADRAQMHRLITCLTASLDALVQDGGAA